MEEEQMQSREREQPPSGVQSDETPGIYTDDDIHSGLLDISSSSSNSSEQYGTVVGLETTDNSIKLTLEFDDGSTETIERNMPQNARLSEETHRLYYSLGLENSDPEQLRGAVIPVRRDSSGITLDIGIQPPTTNKKGTNASEADLSGLLGQIQRFKPQMRFTQIIIAISVLSSLLAPFLFVVLLSSLGVSLSVSFAIAIQVVIAIFLLVLPYLR